jgi:hypothetical protein
MLFNLPDVKNVMYETYKMDISQSDSFATC